MNKVICLVAPSLIFMLSGCGEQQDTQTMECARPEVTEGLVMALPVTTASDEAREHFMQGQRAMDMGRFIEANQHFAYAIEADPTFAHAYLNRANTASSFEEFRTNLDLAAENAEAATETERLLIDIHQKGFVNDVEGQLRLANQLVETQPTSPRAWLTLAGIQTAMSTHDEARTSMMKATELVPEFSVAYMQLGNSYLFNEPTDFPRAQEYFQKVIELEADEQMPHDFLGDVYRAQGELEQARDEYTRAAELDPTNASPVQQRGHVNSFLGDYDAARADYDSAMAMGRANQKPNFALYRAFVHVHAGDAQAAIDELNELVASIDGMGIPEPVGVKIGLLSNVAIIAMHIDNFEAAEQALEQRTSLMMTQADEVGTDEFRRSQEANIAYFDGTLAAREGDYATATMKADEYAALVEPDPNPRKMEPVHDLKGLISLLQGNYAEAVGHYEQGNPNNLYTQYHLALAHEGGDNTEQAKQLFGKIADNNFNSVGFALVRQEAMQKR